MNSLTWLNKRQRKHTLPDKGPADRTSMQLVTSCSNQKGIAVSYSLFSRCQKEVCACLAHTAKVLTNTKALLFRHTKEQQEMLLLQH